MTTVTPLISAFFLVQIFRSLNQIEDLNQIILHPWHLKEKCDPGVSCKPPLGPKHLVSLDAAKTPVALLESMQVWERMLVFC